MAKRRRRAKRRGNVSQAPSTVRERGLPTPASHPAVQKMEQIPAARGHVLPGQHRLAIADVKRSLVIGGAVLVLLIALFLFLG